MLNPHLKPIPSLVVFGNSTWTREAASLAKGASCQGFPIFFRKLRVIIKDNLFGSVKTGWYTFNLLRLCSTSYTNLKVDVLLLCKYL